MKGISRISRPVNEGAYLPFDKPVRRYYTFKSRTVNINIQNVW